MVRCVDLPRDGDPAEVPPLEVAEVFESALSLLAQFAGRLDVALELQRPLGLDALARGVGAVADHPVGRGRGEPSLACGSGAGPAGVVQLPELFRLLGRDHF